MSQIFFQLNLRSFIFKKREREKKKPFFADLVLSFVNAAHFLKEILLFCVNFPQSKKVIFRSSRVFLMMRAKREGQKSKEKTITRMIALTRRPFLMPIYIHQQEEEEVGK